MIRTLPRLCHLMGLLDRRSKRQKKAGHGTGPREAPAVTTCRSWKRPNRQTGQSTLTQDTLTEEVRMNKFRFGLSVMLASACAVLAAGVPSAA